MAKIIFEAHDCDTKSFPSLTEGSVVECEVCGNHWTAFRQIINPNTLNSVLGEQNPIEWMRLGYLDDKGREYNYDLRKPVDPNE